MSTNRKILGATAFTLALAGGGLAGALLGAPTFSSAQAGTARVAPAVEDRGDHWGPGPHGGAGLAVAADAIGITEDELAAAVRDGQSIAQVAEANDVDVQTVIDALVADATTRLEAAIESLPDRMTELVNQEGLPSRGGHGPGGPGGPHGRGPGLDAAAAAIGITEDELATALRDGSTIAEVAEANDVDVQTVIDALVAEVSAHLDEKVAEGDLTEEEAATRKAAAETMVTARVNGERPAGPMGPHGGPGDA